MQTKKLTKMENGENKNLQGRREFFKEAAKKVLPLFAVALIGPSILASCSKESIGCGSSCSGSCKDDCSGNCDAGCQGDCYLGCKDTCGYSCSFGARYV